MVEKFSQPESDFRNVDWVQKQTEQELDTLRPAVVRTAFHKVENWKVIYNMDDVKSYLGNKKNLNWKSLTEKNSGAFITAIQIALERMGYEVGKIDGVFADKGKTTSKTKTAVEKFQKDNGLPPDGIPGPKTITKILEKLPKQPLRTPPNWRTPPQRKPNFPKITP